MKKFLLILALVALIFFSLNLASWLYLGYQTKNLTHTDFTQIEATNQKIQVWTKMYPALSLGAYRLPYISPIYQLVSTSSQLLSQLIPTINQLQPIAQSSLSGQSISQDEITNILKSLSNIQPNLELLKTQIQHPHIIQLSTLFQSEPQRLSVLTQLNTGIQLITTINQHNPVVLDFLGYQEPQHVVVLLQNNMELWPTGGYLGSYASFWLDQGAVKNLTVEAIDIPNGQIQGYVKSPDPIITYVHQGGDPGWTLRASNWDPDFPENFATIDWFFSQGGVAPIDTMIGINLIPIMDFIDSIGGLELLDYQTTINSDNFYATTQKNTSYDFFPGSTQKTDFLGYLSRQLLFQITDNPAQFLLPLATTIGKNLQSNQIIIASNNQNNQELFNQLNWDGGIDPTGCKDGSSDCLHDYLHLNEANLGINKTNCCLERDIDHRINIDTNNQTITHQLRVLYINHNPPTPEPPDEWGGGYRAYLRLYTPQASQLLDIKDDDNNPISPDLIDTSTIKDKTVYAFPILVPGKQAREYTISYQEPIDLNNQTEYQLQIHKQSGIESIPWSFTITYGDTTQLHQLELDRDTSIKFPLQK